MRSAQWEAERARRPPSYQPVLDALNVLGKTPWVINNDVLKVVEEVWARGGGTGDIPPREDAALPRWPAAQFGMRRDGRGGNMYQLLATAMPSRWQVAQHIISAAKTKQYNRELHSQRCDFLIKLQVAR